MLRIAGDPPSEFEQRPCFQIVRLLGCDAFQKLFGLTNFSTLQSIQSSSELRVRAVIQLFKQLAGSINQAGMTGDVGFQHRKHAIPIE